MSASVLYMSMSLDGYVAGPHDDVSNPGGDGFIRLHAWGLTPEGAFQSYGTAGEVLDEYNATESMKSNPSWAGQRTNGYEHY